MLVMAWSATLGAAPGAAGKHLHMIMMRMIRDGETYPKRFLPELNKTQ